jgi:hypothetical protein
MRGEDGGAGKAKRTRAPRHAHSSVRRNCANELRLLDPNQPERREPNEPEGGGMLTNSCDIGRTNPRVLEIQTNPNAAGSKGIKAVAASRQRTRGLRFSPDRANSSEPDRCAIQTNPSAERIIAAVSGRYGER